MDSHFYYQTKFTSQLLSCSCYFKEKGIYDKISKIAINLKNNPMSATVMSDSKS